MTKPTITYGHVWTDDGNSLTDWHHEDGWTDLTGGAMTVVNGDYLEMSCAATDHAGEYCYWTFRNETGGTDLHINTTVNPTFMIRYKTSVATAGLGLAVKAVYSAGPDTAVWIMGSDTTPKYSTTWKVETFSLRTDLGTLDHIRLYAYNQLDHTANSIDVDFFLVCQGIFTWPFTGGVKLRGHNRNRYLEPIGKVGNTTQYLGADSSTLVVYGDIDSTGQDAAGVPQANQGWHGRWTTKDAEAFYQILHYMTSEPWCWFTSDVASFKVTVDDFEINQTDTNKNLLWYQLELHEYRLGSANVETSLERFGIWP